jgi:Tfp pilus assembly protein PilO
MFFRAKQQVLIIMAAVVLACGYVAFRYLPMRKLSMELNQEKATQESLIAQAEVKEAQLPGLQKHLEELQEKLANFDSSIPTDTQLGQFLGKIASLMDEHDLSEQQIAPQNPIENTQLVCIPVTMKGTGRLEQIRDFCQSLQQLNRAIRIEKFHLTNDNEYSGRVHMETEAVIYHRKQTDKS